MVKQWVTSCSFCWWSPLAYRGQHVSYHRAQVKGAHWPLTTHAVRTLWPLSDHWSTGHNSPLQSQAVFTDTVFWLWKAEMICSSNYKIYFRKINISHNIVKFLFCQLWKTQRACLLLNSNKISGSIKTTAANRPWIYTACDLLCIIIRMYKIMTVVEWGVVRGTHNQ